MARKSSSDSGGFLFKTGAFALLAGVAFWLFNMFGSKKEGAPIDTKPPIEISAEASSTTNTVTECQVPEEILPTSTTGDIVRHTWYVLSYDEDHEQAEWVAELANILFDEHSICDSAEFNYYAYDEEFDLNSIVHSFLTSKDLMAQEEEPLRPHRDVFLIDEEMVERNDWDPEDVGRWAFLIQGCYEFFDSQAAALAVYKAVFG